MITLIKLLKLRGLEPVADHYQDGKCNERVAHGYCKQSAFTNSDKCYYHDKLRAGLLENGDAVTIYEDDGDDF